MEFTRKQIARAAALRICGTLSNADPTVEALAERSLPELAENFHQRAEVGIPGTATDTLIGTAVEQAITELTAAAPVTWRAWANSVEVTTLQGEILSPAVGNATTKIGPTRTYPRVGGATDQASYTLDRRGLILAIADELFAADDVGFIRRLIREVANVVAQTPDDVLYERLTSITGFFSTTTGNRLTSNGLDATGLAAALKALRQMKRTRGLRYSPAALLVPAALERTARELLTNIDNPLSLVVEPRLDESSESTWYLTADRRQTDSFVVQFLRGMGRPDVMRLPRKLDFDGEKWRVRLPCGAAGVNRFAVVRAEA